MRLFPLAVGLWIGILPASALAEFQISVYGGANTASDGEVDLSIGALSGSFDVDWFGDSFQKPPYYGVRGTYWLTDFARPNWGVGIDFTHAKVKADLDELPLGAVFERLEFTNGLNSVALNALYRAPLNDWFGLYGGAGAGVSVPHVEVTIPGVTNVREYQVTGPLVQGMVGANLDLGYGVSLFGEYKASYSWNDADLDNGGSLETDILAHHFALGASFSFGGPGRPGLFGASR
jgi:lipid A oxidase